MTLQVPLAWTFVVLFILCVKQVWDIGGQSISSKMLPSYIYGSQVSGIPGIALGHDSSSGGVLVLRCH